MPSLLSLLRTRIARPYVLEMRATLASMARTLRGADAENVTLRAEAAHCAEALDFLRAELAALSPVAKAVRPVSEARRMAILRAVDAFLTDDLGAVTPTATEIAEDICNDTSADPFDGAAFTSIERYVSRVAAEGWIVSDGRKRARYTLTAKGIEALAGERDVAVAS